MNFQPLAGPRNMILDLNTCLAQRVNLSNSGFNGM